MKKTVSFMLVIAVVLCCFASCGKKEKTVTAEVFKIGAVASFSGDNAEYSIEMLNGAQLAVDEINDMHKKGDCLIEFMAEDEGDSAKTAVAAYEKLNNWGMKAMITPFTEKCATAVLKSANKDRVFCLMPAADLKKAADGMDNVITVSERSGESVAGDFVPVDKDGEEFAEAYKEKYGEAPSGYAKCGYDTVYTVFESIKQIGYTEDMTAEQVCEKIIENCK